MSRISMRGSGGVPPIDFIQFSVSQKLYFRPDAQSDMEYNNYSPYPPNSMASDNSYLYTSPNSEEQFPQSYADYHASQYPSSQGPPNDGRYYANLRPHQLPNRESGWGSGIQQPFGTHGTNMSHDMHNIQQSSSEYSSYPHVNQFPPASFPYPMGGDPSHFAPAGPVDPNTGMIFYPSTEGPRLRTAQACQKCRARKAKVIRSTLPSCHLEHSINQSIISSRSVAATILHASDA
jgi:hypothetical protein